MLRKCKRGRSSGCLNACSLQNAEFRQYVAERNILPVGVVVLWYWRRPGVSRAAVSLCFFWGSLLVVVGVDLVVLAVIPLNPKPYL